MAITALTGFAASHAQQPAAVPQVVAQLKAGNTAGALQLAQQALTQHPSDCQLLSLEAVAFSGQQQPGAALAAFQHALARCPNYLPAMEGAAQIEFARSAPEATPLLTRIVKLQPSNIPAHAMLASAFSARGDCSAALPHFAAAQPMLPSHPELQQAYGRCLAESGDPSAALDQYRSLAAQHPSDAFQYDVAVLEWRQGHGPEALASLQPLLVSSRFEPAFSLAARLAESLGDTAHAVEWQRQAILLAPDNLDNYLAFANLAFVHNSFQVGIDMLNAGLARQPAAAALLVARGVLEVQLSQQAKAIADFQQAHKLDPQLALSIDALGIVKTQQHQDRASLALFRDQAKQHPVDPVVLYLLAEQLAEDENTGKADLDAAITAAKRATTLDPQYEPAHDLLAKLYLRAQQPALAVEQARLALAQNPNDQEALYQELMAVRRSGDQTSVKDLVARLNQARKENVQKQQGISRYRLVEGSTP